MENTNNGITEIPVKVHLIGEFNDLKEWQDNMNKCYQKFGFTSPLLHQDRNGFATTGYRLKNLKNETPYPVKTFLLIQDPELTKPEPFKTSNTEEHEIK